MPHSIRLPSLARASRVVPAVVAAWAAAAAAEPLPTVASINVCADQHVLALADHEQILTVSWLAADAEESLFAREARRYALNYGTAEELLKFKPDVVLAGTYTSPFTRTLLRRLGQRVVELAPEASVEDIERNVRVVAEAVGHVERGEQLIAKMHDAVRALDAGRPPRSLPTVIVRPGGFTVGADSLGHELLYLAGLRNVAAEQGLDRWGSLSLETLLRSAPDIIVLSGYHASNASLANMTLRHPALEHLRSRVQTVTVPAPLSACGLPESLRSVELLQQAAGR